jgi:hypothetical protein
VQGRLRNSYLSTRVRSRCAHCGTPIELEIDSDLHIKAQDPECVPIAYVPEVDLFGLDEECIVEAF